MSALDKLFAPAKQPDTPKSVLPVKKVSALDSLFAAPKPALPAPVRPISAPKALPIVAQPKFAPSKLPAATISKPAPSLFAPVVDTSTPNFAGGSLAFTKQTLPGLGSSGASTLQAPTQQQLDKVEPVIQAAKNKLKTKGTANFVAQTAASAISGGVKAGKFLEDAVKNYDYPVLDQNSIGTGKLAFLKQAPKTPEQIAEQDRTGLFAPLVTEADKMTNGLNTESAEWQKASTKEKFSPKFIGETVYNIAPQIVGSLVPYLLNPAAGAIISMGSTAEDTKQKAKSYGVPEENAQRLGAATGVVVGLVDKLSFDKIIPKQAKEAVAKGIINRLLTLVKDGVIEASTEALQENIQIAAEKTFREDLGWNEVASRNVMSAFGGLFGGVGMGSVGTVMGGGKPEQSFELKDGQMVPVATPPASPLAERSVVAPATPASTEPSFNLVNGEMIPVASETPTAPVIAPQVEPVTPAEMVAPEPTVTPQVEPQLSTPETVAPSNEQSFELKNGEMVPVAQSNPTASVQPTVPKLDLPFREVSTVSPGDLGKGIESNPNVEKIKNSIRETKEVSPILVAKDAETGEIFIVDGEHRYKALIDLGVKNIPVFMGKQKGSSGMIEGGFPGLRVPISIPSPKPTPTFIPAPKPLQIRKLENNAVHNRIIDEMVGAQAGKRIMTPKDDGAGFTFSRQASTFPKWVPSELRRKPLFDAVLKHLEEGTLPTKAAEKRLYQVVADEMDAHDAVMRDKAFVESERANLYNPFATDEENAAALAKFDEEYAKLKGKSPSPQASEAPVSPVGKPVQTKTEAAAKEIISTTKVEEKAIKKTDEPKPAPERKAKTSAVFERLKAESDSLEGDLIYEEQNLKENAEKAVALIESDRQQAYRIAMGVEEPPKGQTSTAVNIALAEKALEDGNNKLYGQLVKQRSLAQTRRGQEIVAEKGSVADNSTSRYVKTLIKTRLEKLGKEYLGDLKDSALKKKKGSRAITAIDTEVAKVQKSIDGKKRLDLAAAQKFLDSLACN